MFLPPSVFFFWPAAQVVGRAKARSLLGAGSKSHRRSNEDTVSIFFLFIFPRSAVFVFPPFQFVLVLLFLAWCLVSVFIYLLLTPRPVLFFFAPDDKSHEMATCRSPLLGCSELAAVFLLLSVRTAFEVRGERRS